jgi:hypothetical protein
MITHAAGRDIFRSTRIISQIARIDARSEHPVDGLHILGTMEVRGRIWSSMPSAAPDIGPVNGIAPQRCWRPELPGSYRFGRAARLPQLTLYANDALSQLIQRKEQLAPTHRREKRI